MSISTDVGQDVSLPLESIPRIIEDDLRFGPSGLKRLVAIADLVTISGALTVAFALNRALGGLGVKPAGVACLQVAAISLPMWLAVFVNYRLYSARCVNSRFEETRRLSHAVMVSVVAMAAVSYLTKLEVARSWLVLCFPVVLGMCLLERELTRRCFARLRRSRRLARRVLLVGDNGEALAIQAQLAARAELGYEVVGVVEGSASGDPGSISCDEVLRLAAETEATGVIVATTSVSAVATNRLVRRLTDAGLHAELSASLSDIDARRLTVSPLGERAMFYVEPVRRLGWRAVAKRTFDITATLLALMFLWPLLVVVAVIVRLDSPGKALFFQERVGLGGETFKLLKFRSMVTDAELRLPNLLVDNEADGALFKMKDDPRVTRVGRVIRKFSIDELPQLWNVLRGEMSIVGPRPALAVESMAWSQDLREAKFRVLPGLTGMWQVSGRSNLSFSEYVRLDLYYVDNWSLLRDLSIVARTIPVLLRRQGAY